MMSGLSRSAAARSDAGSATARKAVVLAEADPRPPQLLLDEAVAVEVIGGLEGKERRYQQDHRPEHLVADVEVVVREAAALMREDAVMRVLARIFRQADAVSRP